MLNLLTEYLSCTLFTLVYVGFIWVHMCIFFHFCFYLSNFHFTIFLELVFFSFSCVFFFFFVCVCVLCFLFFFFFNFCMPVCFNTLYWHIKHLVGFWFPEQKLGLSFWGGSTESRTLDCQRILTQGNINQWELLEKHPPDFRTQNHTISCSTQHWMPKSNNKQGKTTNSNQQTGYPHASPDAPPNIALSIRGKKLNCSNQNTGTSPSQYEAYSSHRTNLTHQE